MDDIETTGERLDNEQSEPAEANEEAADTGEAEPKRGCPICGSTRRHKKDCPNAGKGKGSASGGIGAINGASRKRNAPASDSGQSSVILTKDAVSQLIGAIALTASVADSPIWKLRPNEIEMLTEAWYPFLKTYEADIAGYIGPAMLLVPTAMVLGPRVMLRMKIADGTLTNAEAAKMVDPFIDGVGAAMKGENVTVSIPAEEVSHAATAQA
jgi:hypothetical protein